MVRKPKRKTPAVNRLVLLVAAIVTLPVMLFAAYFGSRLLWPGDSAASQIGNDADALSQRQYVPPPETPPPEPDGPILRPRELPGKVIRNLRRKPVPEKSCYRITDGDTLSGIAKVHYGDSTYVQDILGANPQIVSADQIRVGQEITLPPRRGETPAGEPVSDLPDVYVVRRGDTLIGIASKHYGDAAMHQEIFKANRDTLSSADAVLRESMRLRLPPTPSYD